MATETLPRLRIAIIGGGIGGITLANGLVRIPHLDIHVFESKPDFSERGAAVGLSGNAMRALEHLLPSVTETLDKAGGTRNGSCFTLGSGAYAGTVLLSSDPNDSSRVVHRASLLRELLAPLPKSILHANKQLTLITPKEDDVELAFKDGAVETFDVVIGADGIFSTVRKYVLQDELGEYSASPTGFWDCRNMVPIEKVRQVFEDKSEEYFGVHRQYGWFGDRGFIMHDVVDNGTMVQCVIAGVEGEPAKDRHRDLTRDFLETELKSWLDGPIGRKMIDVLLDQPNPQAYSQWDHKATPTYVNGRVCIMGDAAHAMTPWQGAGAGQALEDSVVLATLFEHITLTKDIDAALTAYDTVRRPRAQKIIDSSRGSGLIMCGQDPEASVTPAGIGKALAGRWDFINSVDIPSHKEEALSKLRELQA
ncbi:6-methylsalicylic acid decarboxylase atA [Cladobotryum mycophilum]|uniref:6-methylsalicylic acid decarboxylase atA n=1 Tax=Cladobotryum mycophilum TaxID=491253 RepID=A0ABR0S8A8_9HYPO